VGQHRLSDPLTRRLTFGLFRTHVGGSPEDSSSSGHGLCYRRRLGRGCNRRFGCEGFSETKIEDFDLFVARDHDIGRFQITMNHAFLVRGLETLSYLAAKFQSHVRREWSLQDPVRQRLPIDQLYNDEALPIGFFEAVKGP
jgi:hypothetical protein